MVDVRRRGFIPVVPELASVQQKACTVDGYPSGEVDRRPTGLSALPPKVDLGLADGVQKDGDFTLLEEVCRSSKAGMKTEFRFGYTSHNYTVLVQKSEPLTIFTPKLAENTSKVHPKPRVFYKIC